MVSPAPSSSDAAPRGPLVLLAVLGLVALVALLSSPPAGAEVVNLQVPYHKQEETWYCAEASLQMVLDYWGEEIPQHDIGDVANERQEGGTYASDLLRAARFSNMSTSIQYREGGGARLQGYDQRGYGYGAFAMKWTASQYESSRYRDVMDLVRGGYPVIMLCWLDIDHLTTHYRVVKGFDTDTGEFIVHDPALGANFRINMTVLVDDLWTYYGRWAMVVAPWTVEFDDVDEVGPGEELTLRVMVGYPCPLPFPASETTRMWPQGSVATIRVVPPFALAPGENATKDLGIGRGGEWDALEWKVVAPTDTGFWTSEVEVMAGATVSDVAASYDMYTDRIGGAFAIQLACDALPPVIDRFVVAGGATLIGDPVVDIEYSARDAHSGLEEVRLSIDGGKTWTVLGGTADTIEVRLDLGDGPYTMVLAAVDGVGNSATTNTSLTLDATPPRLLLFQLAGGKEVVTTPRVLVDLLAEDETTSVEMMAVRLGDSQWTLWEPYRSQFEIDLPTDGEFTVEVHLRDSLENTVTATGKVTLDTTPPVISHFEVAGGLGIIREMVVEVSFSARDALDDVLDISLSEDPNGSGASAVPATMASGSSVTLQWTFGGEGTRTLRLTVSDWAQNTADVSWELVVDTQPPMVDLVLNGGERITTRSSIPVAVSAVDATTDVSRARIRVNSNEWGPWSEPSSFRRVDLGPGEGERTVHVQVLDLAGNVADMSASVLLDTVVPSVSVRFTRTEPGGVVHPDSDIELTFSEVMAQSTVAVSLLANASGLVECDLTWVEAGERLSVSPRMSLPRGAHFVLQVQGRDLVGNDLDFRGMVFATEEVEDEEWDAVLPGDSWTGILLLAVVVVVVLAVIALHMRRRD